MTAWIPASDKIEFCKSIRKLGIKQRLDPRFVTICIDSPFTLVVLCPLVMMIALYYESLRQLLSRTWITGNKIFRQTLLMWITVTLTSLFPIYYNHEILFLYFNDMWYQLCWVQIILTFSENLSLYLRWSDVAMLNFPEVEFGIRLTHLFFNMIVEADALSMRNAFFIVDDVASMAFTLHRIHLYTHIDDQDSIESHTTRMPNIGKAGVGGSRRKHLGPISEELIGGERHNLMRAVCHYLVASCSKLRVSLIMLPFFVISCLLMMAPLLDQRITR